jgi:electron transport complex protein RnfD
MDKNILDKFDYAPEKSGKSENKVKESQMRSRIYFEQLLCLGLIVVIAYWNSGARIALMAGFSLFGAVLMDMVGCAMSKKIYNPRDLSTLTAGLCIALLMPAGIDYRLAFFGSALTIAIKHIFGGKDNYIFNPTAAAFSFLILCYPRAMLLFPKPREILPLWEEISPTMLSSLTPAETIGTFDILMGNFTGAMGTVHILVILVTGICLLFRRSISAVVTIAALAANLLFTGAVVSEAGIIRAGLVGLVQGYFLFILVFLVNDPQTLPKTFLGRVYYGLMFGGAAAVFRSYGRVEGYPAFALLFVNTMTERSDILARQTVTGIGRAVVAARRRLNSYERIRRKAETGLSNDTRPALSDTQEIVLGRQDYNMPPVDNKIVKIKRKKQGFFARIKEKLGTMAEKNSLPAPDVQETPQVDFLENLREGVRDLGSVFKKREVISETDEPAEKITPLELSLMIDDNDVVEIEESANTRMKKAKIGNVK